MSSKLPIALTVAAFLHVVVLAIPVAERARQEKAEDRRPAMALMEMEFPERPAIAEPESEPEPEPEPEPPEVPNTPDEPQTEAAPPPPAQDDPVPEPAVPDVPDAPEDPPQAAEPPVEPGGGDGSQSPGEGGIDGPVADGGSLPKAGGPGTKHDAPPGKGPGDHKKARADFVGYGKSLHKRVQKQQRYPRSARALGLEGMAKVKVKVDHKGKLVCEPTLVESTGHEVLDDEALAMVKRAAPFDTLPDTFEKDVATIVLPLSFKLRSKD